MGKKRYKDGVRIYNHPEKSHTRDMWMIDVRHSHMTYIQKNKKKEIERKKKYKDKDMEE